MKDIGSYERAKSLLKKYLSGDCTAEEERIVLYWFYELKKTGSDTVRPKGEVPLSQRLNEQLDARLFPEKKKKEIPLLWLRVTAAVACCLCVFGATFWLKKHDGLQTFDMLAAETTIASGPSANDILPGTNFATLSYSDGKRETLRDSSFLRTSTKQHGGTQTAHLEVPAAGTYKVELEDGTRVWLNAASKLRYPTHFSTDERRVSLEGEAYFEVAKDRDRPFRIDVKDSQIEVLGTSFNVNAYTEAVATSLLEGSVKIRQRHQEMILKPGEQAVVHQQQIKIEKVDPTHATAWQQGDFYFDSHNLREILMQISRWYNVVFKGDIPSQATTVYSGRINRNQKLSNVLEILQLTTGKSFRIEGRHVIIH
ncbi:FecR family protein [Sphingobacterium suaedae]|uniref:FecR family protein n=1 Tax=Sphingobacterium suaedae TaxID=1686402 RepID=A0ABW5KBY0_9SPHI